MHDDGLIYRAISFATRAHRHQLRKDAQTPYVSHPMRVCMVVRHLFGVDDPVALAIAVLHDTIEDTTTDFDDLAEQFGEAVARGVSALSKDTRLPEDERERAYLQRLIDGDWRVAICKLADCYDNISDFSALSAAARSRQLDKTREYLEAIEAQTPPEAVAAVAIVKARLTEVTAVCR